MSSQIALVLLAAISFQGQAKPFNEIVKGDRYSFSRDLPFSKVQRRANKVIGKLGDACLYSYEPALSTSAKVNAGSWKVAVSESFQEGESHRLILIPESPNFNLSAAARAKEQITLVCYPDTEKEDVFSMLGVEVVSELNDFQKNKESICSAFSPLKETCLASSSEEDFFARAQKSCNDRLHRRGISLADSMKSVTCDRELLDLQYARSKVVREKAPSAETSSANNILGHRD